jgi:hypothetical protein
MFPRETPGGGGIKIMKSGGGAGVGVELSEHSREYYEKYM